MKRRDFVTNVMLTGGALGSGLVNQPLIDLFSDRRYILDTSFIEKHKKLIKENILTAMEAIYKSYDGKFDETYRPSSKYNEKVVSFYDYGATGISVIAFHALQGDARALDMLNKIENNIKYYQDKIYGKPLEGTSGTNIFRIPLRRLLLHIALAYEKMEPLLTAEKKHWYAGLIDQQVRFAIEHNENFFPGVTELNLTSTNNHTAIFMQGIYYCGKVFNRPEWVQLTEEFGHRMYDCVRPEGYFEEHTNEKHEGGPSMVYTRLTMGCIYDVLNGKNLKQEKFIKAGNFYRSFVNHDYNMISIADERTNCHNSKGIDYGLALHSLTPEGRYFIADNLDTLDYSKLSIEALSVIHHELDLMQTGDCSVPENRKEGNYRIDLPLGVIRKNGFTAGISSLLALNRILSPGSDYALDQQNMVYLSHKKRGLMLIGYKSKNNPMFSTFRIGDDAYTVKTGDLEMGNGWAEATLYYKTFNSKIRWETGKNARLILSSDSDKTINTTLTVTDEKYIKTEHNFQMMELDGFSPYSQNNKAEKIKCAVFEWQKKLVVDFVI